jgi:hypothetical protein
MGMVNTAVRSGQFFSVRYNCVINGQSFRPAVCYRLTADLQRAVEEMKEKGLARSYPSEVRFVSGVAYPVQKPAAAKAETPILNGDPPKAGAAAPAAGPKGKGNGPRKGAYTQQDRRDFE